ncbi:PREDICTED: ATP-dependent kinase YFH7-like [Camelina sativa]|uniref:ATP-dependent kinase YFH7-like n=1 Tax=Camelina sativa TaxID=90675 RepID=A0ABM1QRL3_CAMSA|nr:PREDICTED: ATP-dependent kinase YFH7-like [Camelina sativa]
MDGFHLYRSQLDAMEDPKEAHARRGAPWTFDPALLLNCLKKLRNELFRDQFMYHHLIMELEIQLKMISLLASSK